MSSLTFATPLAQQEVNCTVFALTPRGAFLRNGPSVSSRWLASLMPSANLRVDGQILGISDGLTWWHTEPYGLFVRSDAVAENGNCAGVPMINVAGTAMVTPVTPVLNGSGGGDLPSPTPLTPTEPPIHTPLSISVHSIGAPGTAASGGCIAIATIAGTDLNSGHICIQNNTVRDCNYSVSSPGNYVIDFGGIGQPHHVWTETNIGTADGGTFTCQ